MHAKIKRHLIVAAASSVEFVRDCPYPLSQRFFYIDVDVFQILAELHSPLFDILADRLQAPFYRESILPADDLLPTQHANMGDASRNVLREKPPVKGNGRIEPAEQIVHALLEATSPHP